jgi:hypothetical protein
MKPSRLPNKTWCTRWRRGPGAEKTEFSFSPVEETNVRRYVFTYFLTSSSLVRLKSLRILVALLGPLILGFSVSVSPGRWLSPGSHQVITVIQNFSQSTSWLRNRKVMWSVVWSFFWNFFRKERKKPSIHKIELLPTHSSSKISVQPKIQSLLYHCWIGGQSQ